MGILDKIAEKILLPVAKKVAPGFAYKLMVNKAVGAEKAHRPHPFSLWSGMGRDPPLKGGTAPTAKPQPSTAPSLQQTSAALAPFSPSGYVAWPSLADRRYTGRHLPPAADGTTGGLPPIAEVVDRLLLRKPGEFTPCAKTSTLFCFFAQWFTDSFLRTDPNDRRRNTSNHEIDFCQIYGLDERTTFALRERRGGRMRLENDLLPRLTDARGVVRSEFADLGHVRDEPGAPQSAFLGERLKEAVTGNLDQAGQPGRWDRMYATGLERGNSTILYTALSTMCVREHNRIANALALLRPRWDDDQLFETARIVMIRNVLAIVVEDYIDHLAGGVGFKLDRSFAEDQHWYRSNRISLEFNLLYRWHGLVPETLTIDGHAYEHKDFRYNNALLEQHGIEHCINAASTQKAGRIQLYNTPAFLREAECATLNMSRTFNLQPFVAYCDRFSMRRPDSIAELVGDDPRAIADLTDLYGTIERVELPIGLIAQTRSKDDKDAVLPPLIRTMVAVDAFTHIFTNPLLAKQVHDAAFEGAAKDIGNLTEGVGGIMGLMARTSKNGVAKPSFEMRAALPTD